MKFSLLVVLFGVGAVLLVVGASVVLLIILARAIFLGTRIGALRVMLRAPDSRQWQRGYARYGRYHLAWAKLFSLKMRPDLLLPRQKVKLVVQPQNEQLGGAVLVTLVYHDKEYELLMSQGDYTGLVSWVDSAPPGELRY